MGLNVKTHKWRSKLTEHLAAENEHDMNDSRITDKDTWLYHAFFDANNPKSNIAKWLSHLNRGEVLIRDGKHIHWNDKQLNLDNVIKKMRNKGKFVDRIAKLLFIFSLLPLLIPVMHYSLTFFAGGVIGLVLWGICLCLMCYDTSVMTLTSKLMSRVRFVDQDTMIKNQRYIFNKMASTLTTLVADAGMIAVNCIVYPFLSQAANANAFAGSVMGNMFINHLILLCVPIAYAFYLFNRYQIFCIKYDREIQEHFVEERYQLVNLHQLIEGQPDEYEANIHIGRSLITGDIIDLNVADRANGVLITGGNGTGKSGSLFEPWITQDLQKYILWLRALPKISKLPNYYSKTVAARYLNGIIVMDTTNSVCETTYELAHKVLGIPSEMIHWLDPSNPNSDSINLMRGTSEKVAETITECINGLSKDSNDFFAEAQREWLESFIYLVKLPSAISDYPPTFDDLFKTCLDISNTEPYIERLKIYTEITRKAQALYYAYTRKFADLKVPYEESIEDDVALYKQFGSDAFKKALEEAANPIDKEFYDATSDLDGKVDRFISTEQLCSDLVNYRFSVNSIKETHGLALPFDEIKTLYRNTSQILNWFNIDIVRLKNETVAGANGKPKTSDDQRLIEKYRGQGLTMHRGKNGYVYFDLKESSVKGVKNILSNLSQSREVRRLFFNLKDNDNFSMDGFLSNGGILLFNTGKSGSLSATLSRTVANIYQSITYSAIQRRKVDDGGAIEPLVAIYQDENIDYMSEEFAYIPGQIRKYNAAIASIVQSYAQIDNKFGSAFRKLLVSTMRTKIAMDDTSPDDGKYLSEMFGKHQEFVARRTQNQIDPSAHQDDNHETRMGSYEMIPNITPEQLAGMQEYTLAIRYNDRNHPVLFDHLKVGLTNKKKLAQSKYRLRMEDNPTEEDRLALETYRNNMTNDNPDFDGLEYILHVYYLRVSAYYHAKEIGKNSNEVAMIDENVATMEDNLKCNYQNVLNLDNRLADKLPVAHLTKQDTHVKGVPDWFFEEIRPLFEINSDDLFPDNSNSNDLVTTSSTITNEGKKHANTSGQEVTFDEVSEYNENFCDAEEIFSNNNDDDLVDSCDNQEDVDQQVIKLKVDN